MLYLKAKSTGTSISSFVTDITSLCIKSSPPSKYFTKSDKPPGKQYSVEDSSGSFIRVIDRFLFKYASSLSLPFIISSSKPLCVNTEWSGLNDIIVPLLLLLPTFSTSVVGSPILYFCL